MFRSKNRRSISPQAALLKNTAQELADPFGDPNRYKIGHDHKSSRGPFQRFWYGGYAHVADNQSAEMKAEVQFLMDKDRSVFHGRAIVKFASLAIIDHFPDSEPPGYRYGTYRTYVATSKSPLVTVAMHDDYGTDLRIAQGLEPERDERIERFDAQYYRGEHLPTDATFSEVLSALGAVAERGGWLELPNPNTMRYLEA